MKRTPAQACDPQRPTLESPQPAVLAAKDGATPHHCRIRAVRRSSLARGMSSSAVTPFGEDLTSAAGRKSGALARDLAQRRHPVGDEALDVKARERGLDIALPAGQVAFL